MPTLDVFNKSNEKVGEIELSDAVFAAEIKEHLFWEVVRNQQANRRAGTHKAKTRGELRGGGAKPFRQKGTGRARQGSSRAHHMVGGAVVHGPQPRDYSYTVPKKVRRQALCSALSLRASENQLFIIDDLALEQSKTKVLKSILDGFGLKKALIVENKDNQNLRLSCRNLQGFQVLPPIGLNVFDILRFDALVMTRSAVENLESNRLSVVTGKTQAEAGE